MTYHLTKKQFGVLEYLRKKGEPQSIYALAIGLKRPYNRVLDNVKLLNEKGLISLSERRIGGRRTIAIHRKQPTQRSQPELTYSRTWSAPLTGVDDDTLIASVISDPTYEDLLRCCLHYGVHRVRSIFHEMISANELKPLVQTSVGRILGNIEIGIARAA